mmetsp:Transcript_13746/g.22336  ORF Transcript_13746/g.22336 Transcript_13746/m.22336 type:complete len:102 (+) Transcript_13746:121-426(+)
MQKHQSILDLKDHVNKKVHVRFQGGREVVGTLKGYDQLVNIVLEDTVEFMRDPEDPSLTTNEMRALGLVVCRGTSVMLVCPAEGYVKTTSPYEQQQEQEAQ